MTEKLVKVIINQDIMREKIQYQDNLFFLSLSIKTLRDGMNLHIDGDLFREQLEGELLSINRVLQKIYVYLSESPHLIRRAEHLHSLLKTKQQYTDLLEELLSGRLVFSEGLQDINSRLRTIYGQQNSDIRDIRTILTEETEESLEKEDIISETEMQFLFSREEDEEENE